MNVGSLETLGTLFTLLPGLLTFLIVRFLTNREKKIEATEAILMGLGYTLIINVVVRAIGGSDIGNVDTNLFSLTIVAITLALAVSLSINNGLIYSALRACKLTSESSWATTWATAFREYEQQKGEHILVYLKDNTKIMGAIKGWSASSERGDIALLESYWINENNEKIYAPGLVLIPRDQITMIQFLSFEWSAPSA